MQLPQDAWASQEMGCRLMRWERPHSSYSHCPGAEPSRCLGRSGSLMERQTAPYYAHGLLGGSFKASIPFPCCDTRHLSIGVAPRAQGG